MSIWIFPHLFALFVFWMSLLICFTVKDFTKYSVINRLIVIVTLSIGLWLIPASFVLLIEVMK